MAEYAHLSIPDPELTARLEQFPLTPAPFEVQERRKRAANRTLDVPFSQSQLKVQEWTVPVNGGEIKVRTYTSLQGDDNRNPLLVWAHGGGFVTGGLFTDDSMLQNLAVDMKLTIVNVDYRLAPEHPFPVGLNDTYDALKWAYKNSHQLGADTARGFILGGCSAGANFTAVLAHRARDDVELQGKLTGQILQVPSIVNYNEIPEKHKNDILSLEQNKNAPILPLASIEWYLKQLQCKNQKDPDLFPIYWPSHKDLPPAYFQICGLDPLRDEGLLYEKLLKEDSVKTRLDIYPGLPHAFETFFPSFSKSTKWNEDLRKAISWILSGRSAGPHT